MLTTAITGAISTALVAMGVNPLPYVPAIWIIVKIFVVLSILALGAFGLRKVSPAKMPAATDEQG